MAPYDSARIFCFPDLKTKLWSKKIYKNKVLKTAFEGVTRILSFLFSVAKAANQTNGSGSEKRRFILRTRIMSWLIRHIWYSGAQQFYFRPGAGINGHFAIVFRVNTGYLTTNVLKIERFINLFGAHCLGRVPLPVFDRFVPMMKENTWDASRQWSAAASNQFAATILILDVAHIHVFLVDCIYVIIFWTYRHYKSAYNGAVMNANCIFTYHYSICIVNFLRKSFAKCRMCSYANGLHWFPWINVHLMAICLCRTCVYFWSGPISLYPQFIVRSEKEFFRNPPRRINVFSVESFVKVLFCLRLFYDLWISPICEFMLRSAWCLFICHQSQFKAVFIPIQPSNSFHSQPFWMETILPILATNSHKNQWNVNKSVC